MKYTEIKSFEDACKATGNDPKALPDFSMIPEKHRKALLSHFMLLIIVMAINEGWEPDWNDDYQRKFYPWLEVEASEEHKGGSGLSLDGVGFWNAFTHVGSRLCYESRKKAEYAFDTFKDLYESYFLIK